MTLIFGALLTWPAIEKNLKIENFSIEECIVLWEQLPEIETTDIILLRIYWKDLLPLWNRARFWVLHKKHRDFIIAEIITFWACLLMEWEIEAIRSLGEERSGGLRKVWLSHCQMCFAKGQVKKRCSEDSKWALQ